MALIIDPDQLAENNEITVLTGSKTVKLQVTGNLSTDGVTVKAVYSKLKELWKSGSVNYIAFPFPMLPITDEQFELYNGWDWDKTVSVTGSGATVNLLRTGGWALKNLSSTTIEEWAGIVTLGSLNFYQAADRVYYQQVAGGVSTDIVLQVTGGVNQAVQTYQAASGTYTSYKTGTLDYRSKFDVFIREYGYTYADANLADIGVTTMTYQVYRFPLTNASDLKINVPDASMSAAPYNSMSITYFTSSQTRSGLVGGSYPFKVIINASTASGTTQQVYNFVQYQLRQSTNINTGSQNAASTGTYIGKTSPLLLNFVGDTLYTLQHATSSGTFVDSINNNNINDIFFVDDSGTNRYYPYAATLTLQFGSNLTTDSNAIYRVFFTNDDAGLNTGRDFGTADAITVQDKNSVYMSGSVAGSSSIIWTYDYDGNVQRGPTSSGTDAPVTVVAIGLATAQYVSAVGSIARSKANAISLVAPLERNYSNP